MRTHTEIELSIANLLALSPLMHLAVAGRKLKLQEERDNYSGPAASHLKTKTALGFEDVSWIMVFFKAFHPAFRQGHDEDAVRVFHSTKCLRNKKRTGGAAPDALDPLDPLDWTEHWRSAQGVCSWLRTAMSAHARRLELRAVDPAWSSHMLAIEPWIVNPKRWLLFSSSENRIKSHK